MIAAVQPSMDASSNSSARRRCCLGVGIGAPPPSPIKPSIGGLDGFCSIIATPAAVVVALTGGTLVADLVLLLPIGLPVHSPDVFGGDRNASRCSRLASSRSSRCRPRTSAGVASGAGEQLAEERLHEDGEGARAASAGDRAPARAAG